MTFIKPVLASNQIIMNVSWLLCIYACFRKILSLDLLLFNTSIHPETQFHTCNGEQFKMTKNCFVSRNVKQLRYVYMDTILGMLQPHGTMVLIDHVIPLLLPNSRRTKFTLPNGSIDKNPCSSANQLLMLGISSANLDLCKLSKRFLQTQTWHSRKKCLEVFRTLI